VKTLRCDILLMATPSLARCALDLTVWFLHRMKEKLIEFLRHASTNRSAFLSLKNHSFCSRCLSSRLASVNEHQSWKASAKTRRVSLAAARWARARCPRRVATCSAHMSKARTIRLLPNLAIALRALRRIADRSRAIASHRLKAARRILRPKLATNFSALRTFLSHSASSRFAAALSLVCCIHRSNTDACTRRESLMIARESATRTRRRSAVSSTHWEKHLNMDRCVIRVRAVASLRRCMRAVFHCSTHRPIARFRPRFAIASAQRSILPAIASQYRFSSTLAHQSENASVSNRLDIRIAARRRMVRRRLLRSTTCNQPLNAANDTRLVMRTSADSSLRRCILYALALFFHRIKAKETFRFVQVSATRRESSRLTFKPSSACISACFLSSTTRSQS